MKATLLGGKLFDDKLPKTAEELRDAAVIVEQNSGGQRKVLPKSLYQLEASRKEEMEDKGSPTADATKADGAVAAGLQMQCD